ncbi:MAG: biotin transporter BioY [Halanaerobiales bacterium]|nr:biotin transporter BioY [Halanaerobiales bacterium]
MKKLKTQEMTVVALFAALTAVGAFIKIPTPIVPFTLQFFFCAYAGALLGSRLGLYSQLLYVGIGLIGIPIFTKGGGLTYIFEPTFGYLIGFIFCAYIIGKYTEKSKEISFIKILIPVVSGLMVVYLIGVPYIYFIVKYYFGKAMTFKQAIVIGFTPFILLDLLKCVIVAYTATKIIPAIRRAGYIK